MEPFTKHTGIVAAMDRANVDTDQIIAKQFLKRIERTGFGQYLFWDWRHNEDGGENLDFELNRPEAAGASILLARRNFGSGSSREHAVWAIADYGFRALIAPSFADIFYNNCFKNGVLPICLADEIVEHLFRRVAAQSGYQLTVDLQECTICDQKDLRIGFSVDPARRHALLEGLDDIAVTLRHEADIAAFEAARGMRPVAVDQP
jgi:3-isopropylmalate/(R)-2-methylmalate dehydratase small subunit